jgi:metal-responsive CopG/Arc/MetJ family transcriptional regulator
MLECDEQWDLSEEVVARTHVVMSDEVLKAVDEVAGKRGRSRFLEEAAREKLERLELAESLEATAGIARARSYRHWRDRSAAATWVRKTRRTESPA